ncbi:hypothetical protein [uncultured Arcticibacterium sp.]|uniref:hypothetical protein n=1 Tax=uncultured Arcticibacterium sp. TaxID=2173042 RepID=UPI0030F5A0EB
MIKKTLLSRTTRLTAIIAIFASLNMFVFATDEDVFLYDYGSFFMRLMLFYLASQMIVIAFLNEVYIEGNSLVVKRIFEKVRSQKFSEITSVKKTLLVNSVFLIPNVKVSFKDGNYARYYPLNNDINLEDYIS